MMNIKLQSELKGYIVGKTIGKGTFGKVKKGVHKITNEPVAIKILEKERIKDIADVERVSRELHILKIARHSAIAQLYEIVETTFAIYIVMEYAGGGEFFDFVMDEKIKSEKEAFLYFSQIVSALIYLHKIGICHRDVKPENMLLDTRNKIKLVDFGLSNMYKTGELLNTACGSPCYASPEMIKGEDYDPELTDVWSLGIVLYTAVMAKLPFEDEDTSSLYNKIKAGIYLVDRKISPELKDLLSRLINTKPKKRLPLKEILTHSWCRKFKSYHHPIHGIQIGFENIQVDMSIIDKMTTLGFERETVLRFIESNIKNESTATYYLFLKKNFKHGRASRMDICSDNFESTLKRSQCYHSVSESSKPKRYKSFDFADILENEKKEYIMTRVNNSLYGIRKGSSKRLKKTITRSSSQQNKNLRHTSMKKIERRQKEINGNGNGNNHNIDIRIRDQNHTELKGNKNNNNNNKIEIYLKVKAENNMKLLRYASNPIRKPLNYIGRMHTEPTNDRNMVKEEYELKRESSELERELDHEPSRLSDCDCNGYVDDYHDYNYDYDYDYNGNKSKLLYEEEEEEEEISEEQRIKKTKPQPQPQHKRKKTVDNNSEIREIYTSVKNSPPKKVTKKESKGGRKEYYDVVEEDISNIFWRKKSTKPLKPNGRPMMMERHGYKREELSRNSHRR